MRLLEFRDYFQKNLSENYSTQEVNVLLKRLLSFFFGWDATYAALNPNHVLVKAEFEKLEFALTELKNHKPIQYITNEAFFFGHDFYVDESVLIPRQETEGLVNWVIADFSENTTSSTLDVLDIGTGSGCIAVSLAKANKRFTVSAIDLSKEALEVAKRNAASNQVNAEFIQKDIRSLDNWKKPLDVIISNPPYVHPDEKKEILPNVLNYEPQMALFTPDYDPIYFYKKIINFAAIVLKSGGALYFEINPKYLEELKSSISDETFEEIEVRNDIFGKARMLKVIKK